MSSLAVIELLLFVGIIVAVAAIAVGVRGVYSISAASREVRRNQTTSRPIVHAGKRRKAA